MAAIQPDPWKALGVDRSADKSEIRTAYKKLVLKCHPDKVQDPTLKAQKANEFQKVQEAWELLNDDDKLDKYEEQVKLAELRRQAAMMAKNMPNSSASRSSPRHMSYEIRTAEPRHKPSTSTPSAGPKGYAHYPSVHSRSHEEMPSRMYPYDEGEKHARRTTSYDKVYREEDRRDREKDDKRRSKREEEDFRIREREQRKEREFREKEKEIQRREQELIQKERELKELERDRESRRSDRKKSEKERDIQKKREVEDKHRRHAKIPYIEQYSSDDQPSTSKTEKRSSSKKPLEREPARDKSTASRRAPTPEPEVAPEVPLAPTPVRAVKLETDMEKAMDYIQRSRRSKTDFAVPISAPTPPPADEEVGPLPIPRSAARRSSHSHEASRSKEKLSSSHKSSSGYNVVDASPKSRPIPSLQKSYTTPILETASSPPRRSSTTREFVAPPSLGRTQTWAPGGVRSGHDVFEEDSDEGPHRRSSRRNSRPDGATRTYKVDSNLKTYAYGESPTSNRKYMPDHPPYDSTHSTYPTQFKVKESRSYGPSDVKYADTPYAYTSSRYDPPSQVY